MYGFYARLAYMVACTNGTISNIAYSFQNIRFKNAQAQYCTGDHISVQENSRRRKTLAIQLVVILFIIILCLVVALALPMRVYASAALITILSETIFCMLATGIASAAAMTWASTIGLPLIVTILIGMGVSLTVGAIVSVLNQQGVLQDFYDKFHEYQITISAAQLGMGLSVFSSAREWVYNHFIAPNDVVENVEVKNDFVGLNLLGNAEFFNTNELLYEVGAGELDQHYKLIENGKEIYNVQTIGDDTYKAICRINEVDLFAGNTGGFKFSFALEFIMQKLVGNEYKQVYKFIADKTGECIVNIPTETVSRNGKTYRYIPAVRFFLPDFLNECIIYTNLEYKANRPFYEPNKYSSSTAHEFYDSTGKGLGRPTLKNGVIYLGGGPVTISGDRQSYQPTTFQQFYSSLAMPVTLQYGETTIQKQEPEITITKATGENSVYNPARDVTKDVADNIDKRIKEGVIAADTPGVITLDIGASSTAGTNSIASDTVITDVSVITDVGVTDLPDDVTVETVGSFDVAFPLASNIILSNLSGLGNKFPFNIPGMVVRFIENTVPKGSVNTCPKFPVNVNLGYKIIHYDLDLSILDDYIGLWRSGVFVLFFIAALLASKKRIWKHNGGA